MSKPFKKGDIVTIKSPRKRSNYMSYVGPNMYSARFKVKDCFQENWENKFRVKIVSLEPGDKNKYMFKDVSGWNAEYYSEGTVYADFLQKENAMETSTSVEMFPII